MTADSQPDGKPPATRTKLLNEKTALIRFAMVAVMVVVCWWFEGQLTSQNRATIEINERTRQIDAKIDSTDHASREAVGAVNATLSTMQERLGSIADELEVAREQMSFVKQQVTDRKTRQAVTESNALNVRTRAQQISRKLTGCSDTREAWEHAIKQLKIREVHSSEAFSRDELDLLHHLFSVEHVDSDQITGWLERLATLQTPVDEVLNEGNDSVQISDEHVQALDRLGQEIETRRTSLQRDLDSLKTLLHRFTAPTPGGTARLEQVVTRHRMQTALAASSRIIAQIHTGNQQADNALAAEIRKTKKVLSDVAVSGEQLLRDAQAEADRQQQQIQARRIREQTEQTRLDDERDRQASRTLAEKQEHQREYAAALPEIRRLLVPFLAAGNRQLNGTDWVQSDGKTPLSHAGIRASGALENNRAGYQAFLWLAGGPHNDRPNGVFPGYIGGDVSNFPCLGSIRRGQVLLSEYGERLVADGLLSP